MAKKTVAKKAGAKKPAAGKAARPMPKLEKSSPALLQAFAQTMAALPMAQTKTVFGSPAAFANGHMFAGIQNESFFLRLPDAERESFMATVSAEQWEPMPGRPMRQYVVIPAPLLEAPEQLNAWLGKSIAYVQALPAKAAKKK
ncbi:MAG: TfoX/Sxy family protein [Anaerolineales bacterium]